MVTVERIIQEYARLGFLTLESYLMTTVVLKVYRSWMMIQQQYWQDLRSWRFMKVKAKTESLSAI